MKNGYLISQSEATFLNLQHLPACLTIEQAAAILGRRPEHIPILIQGHFLTPLGDPPKNGMKLFALVEIQEKAKDVNWLNKANKYLTRHWKQRNSESKKSSEESSLATEKTNLMAA